MTVISTVKIYFGGCICRLCTMLIRNVVTDWSAYILYICKVKHNNISME